MTKPQITVLIPVKNESACLPALLECLKSQTYPHGQTEIVFADNGSTDDSVQQMEAFAVQTDFAAVSVHHCPSTNFMVSLNESACLCHGTYLLRWDAHGWYPPDYNQRTVDRLSAGADACGGTVEFRVLEETPHNLLLLAAEMSPFSCGGSAYRQDAGEPRQVRSMFHPSYRREMLQRSGLWDTRFFRVEDNEFHSRILRCGGQIWLDPAIYSVHYIRSDFAAMVRQKYGNGFGVAKLALYARDAMRLYYLVPLAFFCAVVFCTALCFAGIWQLLALLAAVYFGCGGYFAAKAKAAGRWKLPGMFLCLHLAYGFGTFRGLLHGLIHPEREPRIEYLPKEEPPRCH